MCSILFRKQYIEKKYLFKLYIHSVYQQTFKYFLVVLNNMLVIEKSDSTFLISKHMPVFHASLFLRSESI